ncbi:Tcp11-domain-containing protein [Hysterangium stoloniferum]|nr:Tcp11-domain-containing protein [Hysterangium stoloniferum]
MSCQQEYPLEDWQSPSSATARTGSLLSPVQEAPSPSIPSPASSSSTRPPNILPTITRDTLRELDLESILKNAQLRHDLLFDPGLQFRAVAGKRKQTATDRYWDAIAREFAPVCRCSQYTCRCSPAGSSTGCKPVPNPPPLKGQLAASRVGPMLYELMAVLKCVIAPPPLPSSQPPRQSYLNSVAEAEALLHHFDPILIESEMRHGIYEPGGLFRLIGQTLKRHCAPMRDRLIDKMVDIAVGREGGTGVQRTLDAARLCFEVLELMKLDIANHQLQHLRPFLASSTPEFLLRVFSDRCRHGLTSPANIQSLLQTSFDKIVTLPIPAYIPAQPYPTSIPSPLRRTHIHLAMIKALSEMAFMPPTDSYPETLYLDTARVTLLIADAADLSALYMLIMLWRQLVYWKDGSDGLKCNTFPRLTRKNSKLEHWEVDRIKKEIWEVSPKRVGSCFFVENGERCVPLKNGPSAKAVLTYCVHFSKIPEQYQRINQMVFDNMKWRDAMENVAVQIAARAEDARASDGVDSTTTTSTGATSRRAPSQAAVTLMNGWIAAHLRRNSPLATLFRGHLQREVFNAATRITYGGNPVKTITEIVPGPENTTLGLESLMPEIRHLGQRIAKLALMNMKVYWSLYEADGFLRDPSAEA